jgi:hypothetical protein
MPENELKWRNHYMHTIPLIATATRESADALIALCKADLESTSPALQQADKTKNAGEAQANYSSCQFQF